MIEEPSILIKVDLHCHTEASADCITPLSLFPDRLREKGISVQAITDHDAIWGAQKLQEIVAAEASNGRSDLTIIVGEEVSTTEGEIIGLFLKEEIPPRMSPEETIACIKEQGGLVLLPHGFDPMKRYRLRPEARERLANVIDIIETFNARLSSRRYNQIAREWALAHELPMSAGTDAHTLLDVGSAWTALPEQPINSPQDLLLALQGTNPAGKWVHPWMAFGFKIWDRARRRLQAKWIRMKT